MRYSHQRDNSAKHGLKSGPRHRKPVLAGTNTPDPLWRPTAKELAEAHKKRIADVIAPKLRVLFVGINPGLYTAAIGHYFGRPGNRFWPALFAGGFTPRVLSP